MFYWSVSETKIVLELVVCISEEMFQFAVKESTMAQKLLVLAIE
jgi:hypothetical protein